MRELREATNDYLRQLSRQAQQEGQQQNGENQQSAENSMQMDQNEAESVRFSGRCVAALLADDNVMRHSGGIYTVKELAAEYGFSDPDKEGPDRE